MRGGPGTTIARYEPSVLAATGVLDGSVSQAGSQANLDGNPDLEVGSNTGSSPAGFVIANLAMALERPDVGPAVRKFLSSRSS